jgi:NADH:ubiquinone oxidoreductase subunit E
MPLTFSEKAHKEVEEILGRYPVKSAALLPVMWLVEREFGHLSPDALQLAADTCEVPPVRAQEVVTFYTMYHREPPPRHELEVCTNISCLLRGGREVFKRLRAAFTCDAAGWSPDRAVRVTEVECLGSCGTAPMLAYNRRFCENLSEARLKALVEDIESGRAKPPSPWPALPPTPGPTTAGVLAATRTKDSSA